MASGTKMIMLITMIKIMRSIFSDVYKILWFIFILLISSLILFDITKYIMLLLFKSVFNLFKFVVGSVLNVWLMCRTINWLSFCILIHITRHTFQIGISCFRFMSCINFSSFILILLILLVFLTLCSQICGLIFMVFINYFWKWFNG